MLTTNELNLTDITIDYNGMRDASREWWAANFDNTTDAQKRVHLVQYDDGEVVLKDGRHRLEAQINRGWQYVEASIEVWDAEGEVVSRDVLYIRVK